MTRILAALASLLFATPQPAYANDVSDATAALAAYAGPQFHVLQMAVSGSWALGSYASTSPATNEFYAEVLLYKRATGWNPRSPTSNKIMSAGGVFGSYTMVYTFGVPGLDALSLARQQSDARAADTNGEQFTWINTNFFREYCDAGTNSFGHFTYYEHQADYAGRIVPLHHSEVWHVNRKTGYCEPLPRR